MSTTEIAQPATHESPQSETLTADFVYSDIRRRMHELEADVDSFYGDMGVVKTELTEYNVPGPHRYAVIDETLQKSGAFKSNGAEYAVEQLLKAKPWVEVVVASSAGNWGTALSMAARRKGIQARVHVPGWVSPAKRDLLEQAGATIDDSFTTVVDGLTAARQLEAEDPTVAFLHPYNDPNSIAGQAMVGRRIVDGLLQQAVAGTLDPHHDPVVINIQLGGGSLLAGVACAVREAKDLGLVGDNVHVQVVRPERKANGNLDEKYDGLYVEEPGSYAQTLLNDKRFVQGYTTVSELDAGRAAFRLATALHKRIEPAGLAGAAAYEKEAPDNPVPTFYVQVASGKNVTPETYEVFRDASRRHQERIIGLGDLAVLRHADYDQLRLELNLSETENEGENMRRHTTSVAASVTAGHRTGLVIPVGSATR